MIPDWRAPPPVVRAMIPPPVVGAPAPPAAPSGLGLLAKLALTLAGGAVVLGIAGKLAEKASEGAMRGWKRRNKRDPKVKRWLRRNRPPREWRGTRLEWAYLSMPAGFLTSEPGKLL